MKSVNGYLYFTEHRASLTVCQIRLASLIFGKNVEINGLAKDLAIFGNLKKTTSGA
jgi:hypothetical protein